MVRFKTRWNTSKSWQSSGIVCQQCIHSKVQRTMCSSAAESASRSPVFNHWRPVHDDENKNERQHQEVCWSVCNVLGMKPLFSIKAHTLSCEAMKAVFLAGGIFPYKSGLSSFRELMKLSLFGPNVTWQKLMVQCVILWHGHMYSAFLVGSLHIILSQVSWHN